MNVLFTINEAAPIYKIGGLGDVGGSLPKHLHQLGVDVRLMLPRHPEINLTQFDHFEVDRFNILYKQKSLPVTIYQTLLPQSAIPLYLIEEETYLSQHTDASDNHADKYAVFSLAIAFWVANTQLPWHPDIIHLNDWHTALVPVILNHQLQYLSAKTLITIHNLEYQGMTQTPIIKNLNLPPDSCRILNWDQQDGDLNILLEGLLHADLITTVSPQYAKEILTPEYGARLEETLQPRESKIYGILNGIDTDDFNPEIDPQIDQHYRYQNAPQIKSQLKVALSQELSLENPSPQKPMICFIGRVDGRQKGISLILEALNQKLLPPEDTHFVFLGTGDPQLEQQLHQAADQLNNVKMITRFDESLARKIYAASDLILIPSRYEPCGLIQMIAMRYGTLPVAFATGGLIDTITEADNGFLFRQYNTPAMMASLNQALNTIKDQSIHSTMIRRAMKTDFSWTNSASQYVTLYQHLINHDI